MRTDDNMPRDNKVDADLRAAYRAVATETAPSHLDEAVLAAAANAPAPAAGKGLWQWRRPLAWVTMIGLSFAIVLEFSQTGSDLAPEYSENLPQSAPAEFQDGQPAVAEDAEPGGDSPSRFAPQTLQSESVDDTNRAARQALEEAVATQSESGKRSRDEELEVMSAPAAAEPAERARARMESTAPPPAAAQTTGALGAAASASAERLRADADREADFYVQSGAGEEPACDEATRADPESWRNCIEQLVKAGLKDEAGRETLLFLQAFPDEPVPAPVK